MAKNRVEYEIRARDKTGKATRDARKNVDKTTDSFKNFGKVLKGGLAIGGAIAAFRGLSKVVGDLTEAYSAQEDAEAKLAQAVNNNPLLDRSSAARLQSFASELQQITTVGDEVTISMAGMLASFGRSEGEIRNIITAATDLAAATDLTLESAIRNLNKTFGGLSGELGELIPELKDFTKEQLEAGEAVEMIGEQFEGAAKAAADTYSGSVDGLKAAIGDLAETAGRDFADAAKPFVNWLTDVIGNAASARDAVQSMREEVEKLESGGASQVSDIERARQGLQERREELRTRQTALSGYADTSGGEAALENVKEQIQEVNAQLVALASEERRRARSASESADAAEDTKTKWEILAADLVVMHGNLLGSVDRIEDVNGLLKSEEEIREMQNAAIEDALVNMVTAVVDAGGVVEDWAGENTVIGHWLGEIAEDMEDLSRDLYTAGQGLRDSVAGLQGARGSRGPTGATTPSAGGGAGFIQQVVGQLGGLEGVLSTVTQGLGGFAAAVGGAAISAGALGLAVMAVEQMMHGFTEILGPVINDVLRPLQDLLMGIGGVLGNIVSPLLIALGGILEPLVTIISTLLTPILGQLGMLFQFVSLMLSPLIVALSILAPLFELLTLPTQALMDAFISFNNQVIVPISQSILGMVEKMVNGVVNAINGFIEGINKFVKDLIGIDNLIKSRVSRVDLSSAGPQIINPGGFNPIDVGRGITPPGGDQPENVGDITSGRKINVDITINTDVIAGEGGIRDLAVLIRDEIRAAEALGA